MGSLAIRLTALSLLIATANLMFAEIVVVAGLILSAVGVGFAEFVRARGRDHRYRMASPTTLVEALSAR